VDELGLGEPAKPEEVPVLPLEDAEEEQTHCGYARPIASMLGPTWVPDIRRLKGEPVTPSLDRLPLEPLPPDCPREAEALGEPLATLRHRTWYRILLLFFGLVVMVFGIGFFLLLLTIRVEKPQQGPSDSGQGMLFMVSLGLVGGGGILAWGNIRAMIRFSGQKLWLFPGGVVLQGAREAECYPWEGFPLFWCQITKRDHYSHGPYIGSPWVYFFEFEDHDGRRRRFDSNEYGWAVKAVGDRIQRQSSAAIYLEVSKQLAAGQPVDFPPFVMTAKGLEHHGDFIPWRELDEIIVEARKVKFIDRDGATWTKESLGRIAHSLLFLALVDRFLPPRA